MVRYLCIAGGAALGGVLRYVVASAIAQRFGNTFPVGTLIVNLTGCFCIGLVLTLLQRAGGSTATISLLLVTGFLGGYTTFSSFGWETYVLIRDGFLPRALAYTVGSVVLGVLAVWLGTIVAGSRA